MQLKNILLIVGVSVGVLAGMTAMLWNYSSVEELPLTEIAGDMRNSRGEGEIVVTEFSDFQCPACAGVQSELKEMLGRYEGKVKLVYRHLPLPSIHKHAMTTARYVEAAGEQGKFWEMHDVVFANQRKWEGMDEVEEELLSYASELGLDVERLKEDVEKSEIEERVLLDSRDAVKYKIQGTPTFFVNGEKTAFPEIEAKIKSKLSE
jgi:protein-disulfide isomerase